MSTLVSENKRIDIVDSLRGFALLGIILAHMNNQYYAGFPPEGHENMAIKNGIDAVLQTLSDIFVSGKFYTIFSFLFGLSFGIQMLNAEEKGEAFSGRFAWRLLILFFIGCINQLFYRGDILTIYAILGLFPLLMRKLTNKSLLLFALFFILNIPALIFNTVGYIQRLNKPEISQPQGMPANIDFKKMQEEAKVYYYMVKQGDFPGLAKINITKGFQDKFIFQIFSGRISVTLGLFILGLLMARKKFFEKLTVHKRAIKKGLWYCQAFCLAMIILYLSLGEKLFQTKGVLMLLLSFMVDAFSPALTVVYVACFIIIYQKINWQRRLSVLAPLGRMGLTTYLTQTILGVFIFYGFGLNLLDVIGNGVAFVMGIAIFIVQIFFSKWWMKHYYYGPFEWLWRSLTYLKIQPFKKL
jgi:uncharacterized protein